MRQTGIVILLALMCQGLQAQKVVEKSTKTRPSWVYALENNFLIVEGVGATHEDARTAATVQIKQKMVDAIAVNVSSELQSNVNEQVVDGLFQYRENTTIKTNISTDFLLALKGITLSKANAYYWERVRRKDKQYEIHYHVKYPFSESELNRLIRDYEQLDAQLTKEIELIDTEAEQVGSVRQLAELQRQVGQLQNLLSGSKKSQATLVKSKLDKKASSLRLESRRHTPGLLLLQVTSEGRRLSNDQVQFSSTCAKLISLQYLASEEAYEIRYTTDFCSGSNTESITLKVEHNEVSVQDRFAIPKGDVAEIGINGDIRLLPNGSNARRWIMPLRSFNQFGFTVTTVEITIERSGQRIISSISKKTAESTFVRQTINREYKGVGDYSLEFILAKSTADIDDMINSVLKMKVAYTASGKIFYKSENSDREMVYTFEKVPMVIH